MLIGWTNSRFFLLCSLRLRERTEEDEPNINDLKIGIARRTLLLSLGLRPRSIALSMSNDMRLQCTCYAFFPTSDAFRAHHNEYRVSIQSPAGTELTSSRLSKDIYPLSWKYTGPTRKQMTTIQIATTTTQMYTRDGSLAMNFWRSSNRCLMSLPKTQ